MKVLVTGELNGAFDHLDRLAEAVRSTGAEGVLFTGGVLRAEARRREWDRARSGGGRPDPDREEVAREREEDVRSLARFFRALSELEVPSFVVPGRTDAPERAWLQAAFGAEIADPPVHAVHRGFAPLGSRYVVAGLGGTITEEEREHELFLMYPGWEAKYALEFVRNLDRELILLFHSAPDHLGGSERVAHLIKSYNPVFAACSHPGGRQDQALEGDTLVVAPGRLSDGNYAVLDTLERKAAFGNLR